MSKLKRTQARTRPVTLFTEPSLTDQSFAKDCDVNQIVKRYTKTGLWPATEKQGQYLDISNMPQDLHTALDTVTKANASFLQLPAFLRKRFGNDPQQLLEFINNPDNYEQAYKLGLVDGSKLEQPEQPPVGNPTKPISKTNDDPTTNEKK